MVKENNNIGTDIFINIPHNKSEITDISISISESSSSIDENCNNTKLPTVLPKAKRIIAIGDIHGDYKLMIDSLLLAKVIRKKMVGGRIQKRMINNKKKDVWEWCGGKTIVVQVGDQLDRCRPNEYKCSDPRATKNDESDIKILKFMTNLHKKAKKQGGAVYSLLGNHELMNVEGNLNYVSYEGLQEFGGEEGRKKAFSPGNRYAKYLACNRQSALIIGSTIFIHAGIKKEWAMNNNFNDRKGLKEFNRKIREWLLGNIKTTSVIKNIIHGESSFWTRIFGKIPPNSNMFKCDEFLEPVLEMYNLGHMVVGHTPQFAKFKNQGINSTCNNKLWRVDFGGSQAFSEFDDSEQSGTGPMPSRKVQVLEILNDKEFNILS